MKYVLSNIFPEEYETGRNYLIATEDKYLLQYKNQEDLYSIDLSFPKQKTVLHRDFGNFCGSSSLEELPLTIKELSQIGNMIQPNTECTFNSNGDEKILWILLNTSKYSVKYFNNATQNPELFDLGNGVGLYDRYGWYEDPSAQQVSEQRINVDYILYYFKYSSNIPNTTFKVKITELE